MIFSPIKCCNIDDEESFLKIRSKVSDCPFDLFSENDKKSEFFLNLYENGKIKFDNKEEVIRT